MNKLLTKEYFLETIPEKATRVLMKKEFVPTVWDDSTSITLSLKFHFFPNGKEEEELDYTPYKDILDQKVAIEAMFPEFFGTSALIYLRRLECEVYKLRQQLQDIRQGDDCFEV